jgi:small conductance mechanosensitive channel
MPLKDLVLDLVVRYGFQVLGALVILLAGVVAARWIGRLADRRLARQPIEPPLRILIVRVLKVVVVLLAGVVAMDKFGFQIAPLVAGIGVAGLGVGFALQGVLSNVFAGLTIIFTKPFRVGEYIAVVGVHGQVNTIELFSTTLTHPDRSRVVIPNRKIVGEILHNYGVMRQIALQVVVPHTADLPTVLAACRDVVTSNPRVLKDPAPLLGVSQVSDLGLRISLAPWVPVPDIIVAEAELYQALVERLRALRVPTPLPQREVHLVGGAPA